MNETAFERVLRLVAEVTGHTARGDGRQRQARCPAHQDNNPSLSITAGNERVLIRCHANCETDDVLAALGLTRADLFDEPRQRGDDDGTWVPGGGKATATYPYRDEQGTVLYEVLRIPQPGGKTFRQRVPDPSAKNGWRWKLGDTRRVPYRLPELIAAVNEGIPVIICEGEKDVHALVDEGFVATCNSGGAGKWLPEFAEFLRGADVNVVADRDEPGRAHARKVAATLDGVANTISIVEATVGKDAADHLAAGRPFAEMVTTWTSDEPSAVDLAPDLAEFLSVVDPPTDWVVPGMLERGDRLIWTGFEGLGKSMVIRQVAVAAAAGIHPFNGTLFRPARVLYIDLENSERQGRRHFRRLDEVVRDKGRPVPPGGMHLIHRPAGIDLSRPDDAAWLLERVHAHRPDLLVCGPWYRLATDTEDEAGARRVAQILDTARTKADCAVIIESHAGHGQPGRLREVRPFGSSLLLRWPEMGMGIVPATDEDPCRSVKVRSWRGARDERHWPKALDWDVRPREFPWCDPDVRMLRAVPDLEDRTS